MINDFGSLCKSRMIAPIQLALESHIPMAGFQMALGVLNIGITEVASVLVLGIEKVRFGLVMSLGTFAFIIPFIAFFAESTRRCVIKAKNFFARCTRS
jgi:hypothetical protein